jgi:hypothetical protein
MIFIEKAARLLHFFQNMRRSGTTSLLNEIQKEKEVCIVVSHDHQKHLFDNPRNIFSIGEIAHGKRVGEKPLPVLVDNHTMLEFTEEALTTCDQYEKTIKELKLSCQAKRAERDKWEERAVTLYYMTCSQKKEISILEAEIKKMKSNKIQKLRRRKVYAKAK